ncbi:MAG TPA: hypothetical protein VEB23_16685 [Ramlibacter sp.]|nr:hypothetical protein [Ramlibacter sp.]
MHAAPSVTYPVGRSAFAARLQAALGLLGLAAASAWAWQSPSFGWRQALAFGGVLAGAALAFTSWRRSPAGHLRWDGEAWQWEEGASSTPGRPETALDLQSAMLLRWRPQAGRALWLWVERASDASHWDALRRAVYSRASASIPAFPESGKAPPTAGQPPAAEQ